MYGMWSTIFWVAFLSSANCRPQNLQYENTKSDVELSPLLYGGVFPSWITSDHLQRISNPHFHLYQFIPFPKNGGGASYSHSTKTATNLRELTSTTTTVRNELSKAQTGLKLKEKQVKITEKPSATPMNPINRMISDLTEDSMRSINPSGENSLAPYRYHPLLNFLRQRINLGDSKVIEVRNNKGEVPHKTTTLILKPVARSVAGVDGKAISTPISRAALRKGVNADILFEPDAVAIAGPGGIAHAESSLEIYYEDDAEESR